MSKKRKFKYLAVLTFLLMYSVGLSPHIFVSKVCAPSLTRNLLLWDTTWGGTENDYALGVAAKGGDIYVTGYIYSCGKGGADAFLAKYDANGNQIWDHCWGSTSQDYGQDVAVEGGYIYMVGYTDYWKESYGWEPLLVKYDSDGNVVWDVHFYGSGFGPYTAATFWEISDYADLDALRNHDDPTWLGLMEQAMAYGSPEPTPSWLLREAGDTKITEAKKEP